MTKKFAAILFPLFLFTLTINCQDISSNLRTRYGILLDLGLNQYSANFTKLPGVPNCCPTFRSGSGIGFGIGGLFELPLSEKFLFSVRAGYHSLAGVLKEPETTTVLLANGQPAQGVFEHSINASLSSISLEPMIGFQLFGDFLLYAGIDAGFLTQKNFSQKEQITQPADEGVFTDTKTRIRNDTSGTINNTAGFLPSLKIGASYELPLNRDKTLLASPEIFYTYGLTNIVSGLTWKVNTLSIGVAVKYSPYPVVPLKEEFRKKLEIDTLIIKSKDIAQNQFFEGNPVFRDRKTQQSANILITTETFRRTDTLYIIDRPKPEVSLTTFAIYENNR